MIVQIVQNGRIIASLSIHRYMQNGALNWQDLPRVVEFIYSVTGVFVAQTKLALPKFNFQAGKNDPYRVVLVERRF